MSHYIRITAAIVIALATVSAGHDPVLAQNQPQDRARGRAVGAPADSATNNLYIVQMVEQPVVSYDSGVATLPATRPAPGQKIDPNAPAVVDYRAFLDGRHDQALAGVGGGRKVYDYRYTFNGFAAELTAAQAEALRAQAGVLRVTKDELQTAQTSSTPTFLGLDAQGGLWDRLGGAGRAGEDIIIGVIDSGVWPESLSFSDRTGVNGNDTSGSKLDYQQIPLWHGKCTPGEAFPASKCNQKLIGAQRFNAAWGGDAGIKALRPWEFASPRDYNGHGTHTSSTAGGNHGVALTRAAAVFGSISGIAPRARIAMYKALWSTQDAALASGFTSDLVAAIDQAVADGVDVINYSISGTSIDFLDPAEIAFLFATDAGVFVAASAGNSGPATSTVVHPSPWITTVAAGTHNRNGQGSVTLGNGATYAGASLATPVSAPLIDSTDAGLPGADPVAVSLCFSAGDNGGVPVLDPAKVSGKIVVCDRGVTARVSKSLAVRDAGGVGLVLLNVSPSSLNADFHFVPSVHLSDVDRAAVKAYAAGTGPLATINQATVVFNAPAPFTAAFSSRGPSRASLDLIKPDVIAPGQDIVAAVAPPGNGGRAFDVYSGTSMSSPHVAGLAALLMNMHPDWSPMMIKSALMTTATNVLDGPNTNPLVIFRQGAGHVAPNTAADPGLVYDAGFNDWLAFLCGATTGVSPSACHALSSAGYSLDPSDLNGPSIAIADLPGAQTVSRRVTNVGGAFATYSASTTGLAGFNISVTPSSLSLGPGQSGSFSITFFRTTATLGALTGGQLYWTDGVHTVRSPIVVRPVALAAPVSVSGTGGPISYGVTFGYTGPFSANARGLVSPVLTNDVVTDDPDDSFDPANPLGPGVTKIDVVVPSGTTYARFSLFDANVSPASDVDLYVFRGTTFVGGSGGATSNEEVNLLNPPADTYSVYVHGFAVPGTASFTLFSWALGSTSAGNMTVAAPATAVGGASGTIDLTFGGLSPSTKYLGSVEYTGAAGMPNPTIVRVDP